MARMMLCRTLLALAAVALVSASGSAIDSKLRGCDLVSLRPEDII